MISHPETARDELGSVGGGNGNTTPAGFAGQDDAEYQPVYYSLLEKGNML